MYLFKKLGIPLVALLVLSVLSLITVVLLYENNGLQLPVFDHPKTEAPETELTVETEDTVSMNSEINYFVLSGGKKNE